MNSHSKIELIIEDVVSRVRDGQLRAGDRLRSVREEAAARGVAKNTVVEAYLRLVAQGVVATKPGSGYFVSKIPAKRTRDAAHPSPGAAERAALLNEQLERRLPIRPGDGRLPPDWLDLAELRRPIALPRMATAESYNSPWGFLPLREQLSTILAERGIQCQTDQIMMTYGGNHALDLVIRCYVHAGDPVLVEEPGYYPLFWKLAVAGARIIGVRRNHDGPDLQDLAAKAKSSGARLFFTQSLAQNPTGGSITPGNAYGVLKIAEQANLLVVESDPFADILPATAPRLASLDQLQRVIYVGSFSKTLPGSFRVGYIAASPAIAAELNEMKVITIIATSAQNERLVSALIEDARYLKYLRRLRERIAQATEESVQGLANAGFEVARPLGSGFYLWIELPAWTREMDLVRNAAEQGIFIAASDAFMVSDGGPPGMRVNIAHGANPEFLAWLEGTRTRRK
ncbi:PLP-dependent aminotransferase family protein [Herbaspirillum sp. alder98]|uniref:aminotransferase-like domain-containing protein n=1 Tax=Herbaspirillum sp. alder98 TaxID=2913096 RepID=UPI001CD87A8C|nr:PLP-dependent aminotransferase family protein [Herbaspirillum sp. alder98]MCA1326370.1 PLP-dependent aminotransferase family protein [Herbaspirillum sp. alder98]